MSANATLPPIRILVIDDEKAFTRLLKKSIESLGPYLVQEQNDPRGAIASVKSFHPDIILVDIVMPNMDGGDVVAAFKADPAIKDIPIVYLTATVTSSEVTSNDGVIGGHRFLAKPVNSEVLRRYIDQIVGQRRMQAAAPSHKSAGVDAQATP